MSRFSHPICAIALAASSALSAAQQKTHVLMISIDGLRPDYITAADEHHLKVPTLRSFMQDGTYADGVRGVIPTFTFPSHTTLITGVWPEVHGVYNNQRFDPMGELNGALNTDANMVKVPTLWQAAKAAGYSTGSVGWPVTFGARGIDYCMPAGAAVEGGASDGEPVEKEDPSIHHDNPPGLREMLASHLPPGDLSIDDKRFAWTMAILRLYKPEFMTTHLVDLDHAEHATGPFSNESTKALEFIDGRIAQMIALERSIDPNAYIVIVSDHGFLPVSNKINLGVLFVKAGLIRIQQDAVGRHGDVVSWDAQLWNSGGTSAVILRDPADSVTRDKVKVLLDSAAQNLDYGIARILSHDEVAKMGGGYPEAAFVVEFKPGFAAGQARRGSVVTAAPNTGTHGFLPDRPELRASFFMEGPKVAAGRDLGLIDMRQIAPTIAKILNLQLPNARMQATHYQK